MRHWRNGRDRSAAPFEHVSADRLADLVGAERSSPADLARLPRSNGLAQDDYDWVEKQKVEAEAEALREAEREADAEALLAAEAEAVREAEAEALRAAEAEVEASLAAEAEAARKAESEVKALQAAYAEALREVESLRAEAEALREAEAGAQSEAENDALRPEAQAVSKAWTVLVVLLVVVRQFDNVRRRARRRTV